VEAIENKGKEEGLTVHTPWGLAVKSLGEVVDVGKDMEIGTSNGNSKQRGGHWRGSFPGPFNRVPNNNTIIQHDIAIRFDVNFAYGHLLFDISS